MAIDFAVWYYVMSIQDAVDKDRHVHRGQPFSVIDRVADEHQEELILEVFDKKQIGDTWYFE